MSRQREPLWMIATLHFSTSRKTWLKLMNPPGIINLPLQHARISHHNEVQELIFRKHTGLSPKETENQLPYAHSVSPSPKQGTELHPDGGNKLPNYHQKETYVKGPQEKEGIPEGRTNRLQTSTFLVTGRLTKNIRTFLGLFFLTA